MTWSALPARTCGWLAVGVGNVVADSDGKTGGVLPSHIRRILEVVAESPDGMTLADITAVMQRRVARLDQKRVAKLVVDAVASGSLVQSAGRIRVAEVYEKQHDKQTATSPLTSPAPGGPLRAVAVDVESVVRTTAKDPFVERRIFEIGAVRFGTDAAWIAAEPRRCWFVELPDETWAIRSPSHRERYAASAVNPADALAELHEFTEEARMIVAYNGTEADFPLLEAAYAREGLQGLTPTVVDAYYLSLALWPTAPSHRLAALADDQMIDRSGLAWHDAVDDAELLVRLLKRVGEEVAAWPGDLAGLVASACADSPAWTLARHLAAAARGHAAGELLGEVRAHGPGEIAAVLSPLLAGHAPRRGRVSDAKGTAAGRTRLVIGPSLRGADGRVDPALLASVSLGTTAKRRPAQDQMTTALHHWVDAGVPALVEAPTGTGKSLAMLAAVLDWLASGPDHTAILATFTKQLQAQLANDVGKLGNVVSGLLEASDLVKGQGSRLSLRALVAVLSDATGIGARRLPGPGTPNRFLARPEFRELIVFLVLRLLKSTDVLDSWAAHSVDSVDVPSFFTEHAGPALPVWLESLSQASNGEYPANTGTLMAQHTDVVREALATHRLVLANHALLIAHLEDLTMLGGETLLIVDEAHQLEDAATAGLTTTLDYHAVEDVFSELSIWTDSARRGAQRDRVYEAVRNLGRLLDQEHLPLAVSRAFDARGTGAGVVVGSRAATLASSYSGSAGVGQTRRLARSLRHLAGVCDTVIGSLAAYLEAQGPGLDFFEAERIRALLARCTRIRDASDTIVDDIGGVLGQSAVAADSATSPPDDTDDDHGDAAELDNDDDLGDEVDEVDGMPPDDEAGNEPETSEVQLGPLPPATSNRVVYAEELKAPSGEFRSYRFRIATSPIELAAETVWQQFLTSFTRTYYVSATLRVSGSWQFIRDRLGLPDDMATLDLPTPFDYGRQAELVCFSDFPSWAEQTEGAMRTVAHQLAGYAEEIVTRVDALDDPPPGSRGGFDGGSLVLTTARSTAGGIAGFLATELGARGNGASVLSALVLGNPRAVREFTDAEHGGGVLVGTRGLWQGVDVFDHRRLHLVWINKLPFAPFAAPVIEARRAAITTRAEAAHVDDPDAVASEYYYLPLAALQLRQAVGRLIRSERHFGVIVISDRRLGGLTAFRRAYRKTFLGSLDEGLLRDDPATGERGGGNVVPMAEGWARIWRFFAAHDLLTSTRAEQLCTAKALEDHTVLPQTRRIRELVLTTEEVARHRADGTLGDEVLRRAAAIGGLLRLSDEPVTLKPAQEKIIRAAAAGRNVLGLLPTGFGKSYCFQLPALVLPGVTIVVSPLIALMHDQALELNRSIGGAVRALVAPLRESSSRAGKTEVADQLLGRADHRIRIVYVSPERMCQRRFRQLVRDGVASGIVTRIAVDEAHTFVQWNDFRPSMSRLAQFLADLRRDYGLPVTALTATASRTVHAGLREGLFGLPGEPPGGPTGEAAEEAAGTLVTVRENPIRPELAIFRRSLKQAGLVNTTQLAEEVVGSLRGHAIFYCLTVKEVVALHAHLRDFLGEGGVRVMRFHGRLTEAEKSAVMTAFREAPRQGDEGFVPLVIVATSAFGLGVNRPDVRTVFCVSAPTDLAALYQQIGRAGRDAGTTTNREANVGLALLTSRGLRTAEFMTCTDLSPALLERMGRAVLRCQTVLDATALATALIGEDLDAGRLTRQDAREQRTVDNYTAGVVRSFTALAGLGAVEDLGDFPPYCAVKPGELLNVRSSAAGDTASTPEDLIEDRVITVLLSLPARSNVAGALRRQKLDVGCLDAFLTRTVPAYRTIAEDVADTWQLLADLHDRGLLDVSAAPSRRLVTGIAVDTSTLPRGFLRAAQGKAARAALEIGLLRDFFNDSTTCANRKLADYFGVTDLPDGCCSTPANRCSACWGKPNWPVGEEKPGVAIALENPLVRRDTAGVVAEYMRQRLDEQVFNLVWAVVRGVHPLNVLRALRGEETYFLRGVDHPRRLESVLIDSRYFGVKPTLRLSDVEQSLVRLEADGRVVRDGVRWREVSHVQREIRQRSRTGTGRAS